MAIVTEINIFLLHENLMKYIFLKLSFSFFFFLFSFSSPFFFFLYLFFLYFLFSQYMWPVKVITVEEMGKKVTESVE